MKKYAFLSNPSLRYDSRHACAEQAARNRYGNEMVSRMLASDSSSASGSRGSRIADFFRPIVAVFLNRRRQGGIFPS
ncbi:MAG: hypothetical protein A2Z99_07345 [Treponema sp. GWB1_62_6]|nr:MAG: hypothetical protein A2Z99_07345 [Treponema sp. GWB1_62_6]OHE65560.1 MAG: hypothetical protein A2001_10570 [Treponema sp. GWC1_61_84]OHE72701.1 MAG: hypothetical protein A2413_12440 [Treponema sp. RIFOXYC1_FULL_61_9]HCM27765.1 hypothetical protein [Treponema sp.]